MRIKQLSKTLLIYNSIYGTERLEIVYAHVATLCHRLYFELYSGLDEDYNPPSILLVYGLGNNCTRGPPESIAYKRVLVQ
ncbi:hypothetical protein A8709_13145 [Paenibacillus pectinilyticus]|uniref:Uncharacterized protein n=1 Tax=Paenibacillus pectinilyticus TaxID=512399 RepID=A0A1C1A3D4_9BACL|nr:hypothetical protein [Paenibacillus pectinilyticus]OCT15056.1 hypothetical protein A8709_13145 [Paenibacillus pectinilyticus]